MKYIIDVPEGIDKMITKLIGNGDYSTIQNFALTAIQNQLLIEETSKAGDIYCEKHGDNQNVDLKPLESRWILSTNKGGTNIKTCVDSQKSNDWLFGQVNRILPIKFGLRILISYQEESSSELDLDWFLENAADQARIFGKLIEDQDIQNNIRREERVSVGFPLGKQEKSLNRYRSHFLGYKQLKTGHSVGALPELGFVSIFHKKGKVKIGITDGGLQFGLLKNPIIDGSYSDLTMSLEESHFYIHHILKHAPGEVRALGMIINMINRNINKPKDMNDEIAKNYPKWSNAQCVTNRSGAIGRAFDLGIVERNRKGNEVVYEITDHGKDVLSLF